MASYTKIKEIIGLMQKNLECSICLDVLSNPVSTKCGHQFCRYCLMEFLDKKKSVPCPLCKKAITKRSLTERVQLKEIVNNVQGLIAALQKDTGIIYSPLHGPQSFITCTPEPLPVHSRGSKRRISLPEELPSRRKLAHAQECIDFLPERQEIDMTMSWPRNVRQSKRRKSEDGMICNFDLSGLGNGEKNLLPEDGAEECLPIRANRSTRSKDKKKANMKLESKNGNQLHKVLKADNQTVLLSAIERIHTASRKSVKDGPEPGSSSQSELLKYIETGICGGHTESQSRGDNHVTTLDNSLQEHEFHESSVDSDVVSVTKNLSDSEQVDIEVTPNLKPSTYLRETRSNSKIHKVKSVQDEIETMEFSHTEGEVQLTDVSKVDSESSGQHSLFKTPTMAVPNFTKTEVPWPVRSCRNEVVNYNEEHDPVTVFLCTTPNDNGWHKGDPIIDEHNKVARTYSRKNRGRSSHSSKVSDWLKTLPGETSETKTSESHDWNEDKQATKMTMRNRKGKKEDKLGGKIRLLSKCEENVNEDIEHMFGLDDLVSNPSQRKEAKKQETSEDGSRSKGIKITNVSEEENICKTSGNIFENMTMVHYSSEMVKLSGKDNENKNKYASSNITSDSKPFTEDKPENTRVPATPDKTENTKAQDTSDKTVNTGTSVTQSMTVNIRSVPVMPDNIDNIRKTITSDEIEVLGNMKPVIHSETVNTTKTLNEQLNNSNMNMNWGSCNGRTFESTKEQRIQSEEPKQPLPLQRRRIFKVIGKSSQADPTKAQALPKELLSNETSKLNLVCRVVSAVNAVERNPDPYEFKSSPKATQVQKGKKERGVKNREKQSNKLINPIELMIKAVSVRNNMERSQKRNPDMEVMIIQETSNLRFMSEKCDTKEIQEDDCPGSQVKDRGGKTDTDRNIFPNDLERTNQKKKTSTKIAAAMKSKEEMQQLVDKISEAEEYDLLTCTQEAVQSLEREQSSHSTTPNVAMETQDIESIISVSCVKRVRFMEPLDRDTGRGQGQRAKTHQGQQVPKGIVKNKKNAKEPHSKNVYRSYADTSVEKTDSERARKIMDEIPCTEDPFEVIHLDDDAVETFGCNSDEKVSIPEQSCHTGKVSSTEKTCTGSRVSTMEESHHNVKAPMPEKNHYGGRVHMQEETCNIETHTAEFKNPMWTPTSSTRRKTEDDKDDGVVEKEDSDIDDVDADSSAIIDLEIHPQENDFKEPDIAIQTEEIKLKLSEFQKSSYSQNLVHTPANVNDRNKEEVMLVEETPAFVMKTDTVEEGNWSYRTSDPSLTQTPECQIITQDNMKEMGDSAAPSLTTADSLDILEKAVNGLIQEAILDQNNADKKENISEPCPTPSHTLNEIGDIEEADRQSTQESLSILAPVDKEDSKIQIITDMGNEENNNSENEYGMIQKPRLKSKRKCFSLEISPAKVISSEIIKRAEDAESKLKDVTDSVRKKAKRGRLARTKGKDSQYFEQSNSCSAFIVLETQSENGNRAQKQWVHRAIESQECVPETILDSLGTWTFQESLEGDTLLNSSIQEKFKGSARGELAENSSQSETVQELLCQDNSIDMNKAIEKYIKNMNNYVTSSAKAVNDLCPVSNPVHVLEAQILDSYTGSHDRDDSVAGLEDTSNHAIKNKNLKKIKGGKKTLNTSHGRNSVNTFSGISLESFTDLELMDTQTLEMSFRDKTKSDAQNPLNSCGIIQEEEVKQREQSAYSPEDIFQMDSEMPMLDRSPTQLELDDLANRYFALGNGKCPVKSHLHTSKSAEEKNESKSTLEELIELDFGAKSLKFVPRSPFQHSTVNRGSSISPLHLSNKSTLGRQDHTTEKNQGTGTPKQVPVEKTKFKSRTTPPKSSPDARILRSRIEKQTQASTLKSSLPCSKEGIHDSSAPIPTNSPDRLDDNFHQSTIHGGKEKMLTPQLSAKNLNIDSDSDSDLSQKLRQRRKSGVRGVRGFSSKKCKQGISETSNSSISFSAKGLCANSHAALSRFDSEAEKVSDLPKVSKVEAGSIVGLGFEYENTGKTSALRTLAKASLKYQNTTNTIDACKEDMVSKKRMNNKKTSPAFVLKSPHKSQQTSTKKCFLHGQSEIGYKTKSRSWKRKDSLNKFKQISEMTYKSLDDVELKSHIVDVHVDPSEITDKLHEVDIKPMNHVEPQDMPLNPQSFDNESHCSDVEPLDVDNELHDMKAEFHVEVGEPQQRNELHVSLVEPLTVDSEPYDINVDQHEVKNESQNVNKNSQTVNENVHVDVTVPDSYPASGSFQVQSQRLSMIKSEDDFRKEGIYKMIDNVGETIQRSGMKKMVDDELAKAQTYGVPLHNYLQENDGDYNDTIGKKVMGEKDGLSPYDGEDVDTLPNFEFQDELAEEQFSLSEEDDDGDMAACENVISVGHRFETSSPIPKITGAKVIEIYGSYVDDDLDSDEPDRSKKQRTRVFEDTDSDDAKSQDSSTSCYMNLTSSSAISSQSETLTTQQRDVLENDLDRMRKEMQEIEAQLAANRVSSRKSDSGESRKWSYYNDDPSPSAKRNLLSEETVKDASVKELNLGKDNDIVDVELIADSQRIYQQKQVAEPPVIDIDSHIETEDSGEDSDDLFLSPLPLSPESLPSPGGRDRSRTPIPDIVRNVEDLFSEIREQMEVGEDECQSPGEKGRMVKQEKRNIKSQKSPKKRPPLNEIVQISSNIPEKATSRPCVRGFVASGLSVEQAQEVRKLASLNDCKFYNKFNPSVSHVIVKSDKQNNRLCDRTLKFFQGIAHHCWIVSFQWVVDSRTAGHLLPEDAYEIQGDTANGNIHFGPKRSRLSNSSLVGQCAFCCIGESPGLSADDMRDLLEECGGTIIPDVSQLSYSDRTPLIIACSEVDDEDEGESKEFIQREIAKFNEIYRKHQVVTLSREWVLDSLTLYRLQPLEEYVLTTHKNMKLPKIS